MNDNFDINEVENESMEDTFKRWKEEFKRDHPIYEWINKILFRGRFFMGYSPHYSLTHPFVLLKDLWNKIVWAWQRVYRGWDDRVVWAINSHLSKSMVEWITEFKKVQHGYCLIDYNPETDDYVDSDGIICMNPEAEERNKDAWNKILDQIKEGFESAIIIDKESLWKSDADYYIHRKKFELAMDLLKEYYDGLWD